MEKNAARLKAENALLHMVETFDDSSKYNTVAYKNLFSKMSDKEFKEFMRKLLNEEEYVSLEIDTSKKELTLDKVFKKCESLGYKTHKYIKYRDNKSGDGTESVTPFPTLILYIQVKRLQQMIDKKNSASGNIDKINPLTGGVTSDSKSASINDTQLAGLITTKQFSSIKELMGPRSDDFHSKKSFLHYIEENGAVSLKNLSIRTGNKQALETLAVFMKGVHIDMKIKSNEKEEG